MYTGSFGILAQYTAIGAVHAVNGELGLLERVDRPCRRTDGWVADIASGSG
jgi:hypothetical protein